MKNGEKTIHFYYVVKFSLNVYFNAVLGKCTFKMKAVLALLCFSLTNCKHHTRPKVRSCVCVERVGIINKLIYYC